MAVLRVSYLGAILTFTGLSGCDAFAPGTNLGTGGELIYPWEQSGGTGGVGGSGGGISLGTGGATVDEDPDRDQLPTADELKVGLDPDKSDTDGDGCSDYFDSAFPACDGSVLMNYGSQCDNLGRYVAIASFPEALKGQVVKFEAAWFSNVENGLGGAGSSDLWEAVEADGEPVVFIDERWRWVALPLTTVPTTDVARNAADIDVVRLRLRALDYSSGDELCRWIAYRGIGETCTVP